MDLALYDPRLGYYARAVQRSGRAGDFFTSVDVGGIFGTLLESQMAEMADLLAGARSPQPAASFDLVEAGAGNGRLSADILRASRQAHPEVYARTALHLVEASPAARAAQRDTLGDMADRLASSSDALPSSFEGVLFANELLDALPVHQVVMREDGLKEIYVTVPPEAESLRSRPRASEAAAASAGGAPRELRESGSPRELVTVEGPPSTPALGEYLARLGVALEPGWRVEINLRAVEWVRDAARRLRCGFLVLIDYGHEARDLYSVAHSSGTLTTFSRHVAAGAEQPADQPAWLRRAGEQDITAHLDFTSVRNAAVEEGLTTLGFLDQTYFLMGIMNARGMPELDLRGRLALKTLVLPGGLGSTLKVLILGKDVGTPALSGCSYRTRVT
jgi:SAM-dependent MidA family methyltransferase